MLEIESTKRADPYSIMNQIEKLEQMADNLNQMDPAGSQEIFQVPPEVQIPNPTLPFRKPNLRKTSETGDNLELFFEGDFNSLAARKIKTQSELDFIKHGLMDPEQLNACHFTSTVLANFKLYSLSDDHLKMCQAVAGSRPDPISLQIYIRICFMRINNLKILNKKMEALEIATGLSYFMIGNKSAFPSVISELLVSISNLQFLTNDLGQSLDQLLHAETVIRKVDIDDNIDNKLSMVNLMLAKIHYSLGNYQIAKNAISQNQEKSQKEKPDFLLLKAECCLKMKHFREAESILLKLERRLDEQRKQDAEIFIKIQLIYFTIALIKNNTKAMNSRKASFSKFMALASQNKPLYMVVFHAMQGLCKLELDNEAAAEELEQAISFLDQVSAEHLHLRLSVFEILLRLVFECQYQPIHLRYVDRVLKDIETQCIPDHFCILPIIQMKCQILLKNDQFEEGKRIALNLREICKPVEEKMENWSLIFESWAAYPKLLYEQGFLVSAYAEFEETQNYLENLTNERKYGKIPSLGQLDPINLYLVVCRVWMYKIEADVEPRHEALKEMLSIIETLKTNFSEDTEEILFAAYAVYFRITFNLARKKAERLATKPSSPDTTINSLIRFINNTKNVAIKLEGIFIVSEYLAMIEMFKDCENYMEKAYFLISNEPELIPRKHELNIRFKSKAFRILAQYNMLTGEDDFEVTSRASKLLKSLKLEINAKRSKTANSLSYIKARYRICLALVELSEHNKAEKEYVALLKDILRLRYRVGHWQYYCRLAIIRSNIEIEASMGQQEQMVAELIEEAAEIFGKTSSQLKVAKELKAVVGKRI